MPSRKTQLEMFDLPSRGCANLLLLLNRHVLLTFGIDYAAAALEFTPRTHPLPRLLLLLLVSVCLPDGWGSRAVLAAPEAEALAKL